MYLEILDKPRQELLNKLKQLPGFVLGGGTALALQINHRKSFDFDFFSPSEISPSLIQRLDKIVGVKQVLVNTPDELTVYTHEQAKLTFLYYPFPKVFEMTSIIDGIKMFTAEAIASQKAYTVGRRGEYRDYFDLYSLLNQSEVSLIEIIKAAELIYGSLFNPKLFLEQLIFFADLLDFSILPVSKDLTLPDPEEVKKFLTGQVTKYLADLRFAR